MYIGTYSKRNGSNSDFRWYAAGYTLPSTGATSWLRVLPYLVLVRANQGLLVVVREEAVFQTEVSWLPAREVLALLHQVTLPCHTSRTN